MGGIWGKSTRLSNACTGISLGGHCRVGMEDTVYLSKGVKTPGNGALVEKAVQLIQTLGGQVATVNEARQILGLSLPS